MSVFTSTGLFSCQIAYYRHVKSINVNEENIPDYYSFNLHFTTNERKYILIRFWPFRSPYDFTERYFQSTY